MSKLVKNMMMQDLQSRLQDVGEVFVISLGQLDAQKTTELRLALRKKNISLQLVKNNLARRALAESPLAPALENLGGMLALCWGGEDVVDLAKELNRFTGEAGFEAIECRGGAMDGTQLEPEDLKRVAKWPSRLEQLSILSGQLCSVGSTISGQLLGGGGTLAGQLASRIDDLEKAGGDAEPAA
jgi:large subunit ribosomal protein L10